MTSSQKIIKYIAMGLAILLTITIISGIGMILFGIFGFAAFESSCERNVVYPIAEVIYDESNNEYANFENYGSSYDPSEMATWEHLIPNDSTLYFSNTDYYEIENLDITNSYGKLDVYCVSDADRISVYASGVSNNFSCKQDDDTLIIEDKTNMTSFIGIQNEENMPVIVVILPEIYPESSEFTNGAGSLSVHNLYTDELSLSAGAGTVSFIGVSTQEADIECGVGKATFDACEFYDADIECGVGSTYFSGVLYGDCKIVGGIGKAVFELQSYAEEYDISLSCGIGNIMVDGTSYNSSSKHTRLNRGAPYSLSLKGGVGNISVDFLDSY